MSISLESFCGSQQNYKDNSQSKFTAARHHQQLTTCFDYVMKLYWKALAELEQNVPQRKVKDNTLEMISSDCDRFESPLDQKRNLTTAARRF